MAGNRTIDKAPSTPCSESAIKRPLADGHVGQNDKALTEQLVRFDTENLAEEGVFLKVVRHLLTWFRKDTAIEGSPFISLEITYGTHSSRRN
jgi:hypothetical protein